MLKSNFPEIHWKEEKFGKREETGYWTNESVQRQFMESIAKKLDIHHWEDWLYIKAQDIRLLGGHSLLSVYDGSILKLLTAVYPGFYSYL